MSGPDGRFLPWRMTERREPLKKKVGQLSGGQKAQLALTIALARRPDLLVLDEPLAALDPLARHDFMASVMETTAADGAPGRDFSFLKKRCRSSAGTSP